MKKSLGSIVVVFLILPSLGIGKHKEDKVDPRLKQIHTIFLKGAFTAIQQVQGNRVEIDKDSCLRLAEDADSADAIAKLSYTPGGIERISTANIQNPDVAIQQVQPYHTALELSVREGSKMKKIWEKHVDLDRAQQGSQPGVFRLMDLLRHDACDGR